MSETWYCLGALFGMDSVSVVSVELKRPLASRSGLSRTSACQDVRNRPLPWRQWKVALSVKTGHMSVTVPFSDAVSAPCPSVMSFQNF